MTPETGNLALLKADNNADYLNVGAADDGANQYARYLSVIRQRRWLPNDLKKHRKIYEELFAADASNLTVDNIAKYTLLTMIDSYLKKLMYATAPFDDDSYTKFKLGNQEIFGNSTMINQLNELGELNSYNDTSSANYRTWHHHENSIRWNYLNRLKTLENVTNTNKTLFVHEKKSLESKLANPLVHLNSTEMGDLLALQDMFDLRSDVGQDKIDNWLRRLFEWYPAKEKLQKAKSEFTLDDQHMLNGLLRYEGYMLSEHMYSETRFMDTLKEGLLAQHTALSNGATLANSNPTQYITTIALVKMHKVYHMKKERIMYGNRMKTNKVIKAAVNVGATGTQCMCYDGQVYEAGDHMNAGATFNCVGGIIGKFYGPDKKYAAKKVVCGVNHKAIETKHLLARVCNGVRLTWIKGFIQRYKFMSNYMIDQYQRWGVHNDNLPGLTENDLKETSVAAKALYDEHNLDANTKSAATKYSFFYPVIRRNFDEILSIMLDSIKFYENTIDTVKLPDNEVAVQDMLEKFSSATDMEDIDLFEAQFADLYSEYNTRFESSMKAFSNIIEKVERRLVNWLRIKKWDDDTEQVHPQKWVKWLSQQIDDWIVPRWQYGWQFCVNRLLTIQKELECTFLDLGYGPCYDGDLASDITSTVNATNNTRLLNEVNMIEQPELHRAIALPEPIISDIVLEYPHRILNLDIMLESPHRKLTESNSNNTNSTEPEEPVEDWTTPIEKSDAETEAANALQTIENDAMTWTKKLMNEDFTAIDEWLGLLNTNYTDTAYDPATSPENELLFPSTLAQADIATELTKIIEERAEFRDEHEKMKSWNQNHRIDLDWNFIVNDIARIQAATIAGTYTNSTIMVNNTSVNIDLHRGSTYNTQMEEHYMNNTGSTLKDRMDCFLQSRSEIEVSESIWIGDTNESFGGEQIAKTLFLDVSNKDTGVQNRQNFMNRDFRWIGVSCSIMTDFALESLRGKKVCVFVFVGGVGGITRMKNDRKRHCTDSVVTEVKRGFKRNDVNTLPQITSNPDRLSKAMLYEKIVDKGYIHTIALNSTDPGFIGQDWTVFSAEFQTKLDGWRTQEYPVTLSVIQKVQHIMNVFTQMRTGLDVNHCQEQLKTYEYYVKHNHFNGVFQDARLNGFLMNIFDFNKPFVPETAPPILTASELSVDSNLKILVDYKFYFKECQKDEHFLADVPDTDCQIFLQNPPQIEEGHSYDGRLLAQADSNNSLEELMEMKH